MANFVAVTSSNGAKVSPAFAVRKELEKFYVDAGEGEVVPCLEEKDGATFVGFWSYGWFSVHPWLPYSDRTESEPNYNVDAIDNLLKAIQPYLLEPLVIQSVGFEKLRFPLAAQEIVVPPGMGEITFTMFTNGEEAPGQAQREVGAATEATTQSDSSRLEWLMRKVSGAELRRLGVDVEGNCCVGDMDVAMRRKFGVRDDMG